MKYLVLIFTILWFVSCSDLKQEIIEYHPNGDPKTIQFFKGSDSAKLKVKEIQYYPDGQLAFEKSFKNNKPHGEWKFWHKNGFVWSEGCYQAGLRMGTAKVYHENGQLFFTGQYTKGKKDGEWLFYNEQGELETKTVFDLGKVIENWNANNGKQD